MVEENNKFKKLSTILDYDGFENFFKNVAAKFVCLNKDVEGFIQEKAILYEQRGKSRTYVLFDESNGEIIAYYTLSLKSISFGKDVSKSVIKHIDGFSKDVDSVAVVLIGQLGKNHLKRDCIKGNTLLESAIDNVYKVKDIVGGRVCLVETEDTDANKKVIDFYLSNGFKILQQDDEKKYLQLFKKL